MNPVLKYEGSRNMNTPRQGDFGEDSKILGFKARK